MKSELGDKQRIEHISDACSKILLCTKDYNEEKFVNDFIIAAAVHSFIMIIGEASNAVSKDFKKEDELLVSYDVAHHAGLSLKEEYELLGLLQENQRLEYLKRHLNKVIPLIGGIDSLKEKIQLNGHFKELKGFNLDF